MLTPRASQITPVLVYQICWVVCHHTRREYGAEAPWGQIHRLQSWLETVLTEFAHHVKALLQFI